MCQEEVTMSSICPRLDTVDVQRKIELTITAFKNLSDTHSCRFVNNDNLFKLADKTVNDCPLMRDRVHLTWQASNKLARNLKLKTTEKCVSLYRSRGRPRQTRYASNYKRSDENQTRPTERKYKGLKHSQQDNDKTIITDMIPTITEVTRTETTSRYKESGTSKEVTHIILEKINTDMTPITVKVTTAGNSNVNATENYRTKKEIGT